jgi:hypothetical protein
MLLEHLGSSADTDNIENSTVSDSSVAGIFSFSQILRSGPPSLPYS